MSTALGECGILWRAMACPHKPTCELFPRLSLKPLMGVWIDNYCDANYERCARFQLSCEQKLVPITLLPNGKLLTAMPDGKK